MIVMQGVHKVGDIFPLEEIYNAENQGHGKHQQFGDDFLLAGPVEDSKIQQQIKWEPYLETCGGNLFPLLGGWECFKHGDYNRNQQ